MKEIISIAVFTGSRSDFDRLYPVCREINANLQCKLQLIVAHAHLSRKYGYTIDNIIETGLPIAERIKMLKSTKEQIGMAESISIGVRKLAEVLSRIKPDIVLVLGDRFELLSVISTCICLAIPIAHIGGGQFTEGAIDDQIRHVITKAAHIHFVANKRFAQNIIQMGEEPWRVHVTGSPSIDALIDIELKSRKELSSEIKLDFTKSTALVAYHSSTLELNRSRKNNQEFFAALKGLDLQLLLTYPNPDSGSEEIIKQMHDLVKNHKYRCILIKNLGRVLFANVLRNAKMIIGNSSSGIVEAPTFNIPVVNVGTRQEGRMSAENVFNCKFDKKEILEAVRKAQNYNRKNCSKPYGDGKSANKIVRQLVEILSQKNKNEIMRKHFHTYSGVV